MQSETAITCSLYYFLLEEKLIFVFIHNHEHDFYLNKIQNSYMGSRMRVILLTKNRMNNLFFLILRLYLILRCCSAVAYPSPFAKTLLNHNRYEAKTVIMEKIDSVININFK